MIYILTKEYSDKSAFYVCGTTDLPDVARAWFVAGSQADPQCCVYSFDPSIGLSIDGSALKPWGEDTKF